MKKEEWIRHIQGRVPDAALTYCFSLWEAKPFHFVISRSRSSKLGDFRFRRDQPIQKITINHDLNPYQFLITYIHEVAHHRVYAAHSQRCLPHGVEWKRTFQELMLPMIADRSVFPLDILIPLRRHMLNPKASSGADLFLMKELRKYDPQDPEMQKTLLSDVKLGEKFELKNRVFQKLESRRTRALCLEVATGKKYLISGHAAVINK
nr:transcription elongation protein SprT [Cytophagales bacterium]